MREVLSLTSVTRTFPGAPEVHALRGVDLSVRESDYISIVGPSGSGKSTLLNVLGLLDTPSSGRYELAGTSTEGMSDDERAHLRARYLGFVFQSFHLMPRRSVLENVMMPMQYNSTPRSRREGIAREALGLVGLSERVDFAPTLLSGGERQRVAIARAISGQPQVLLADEPTGNLDASTTDEIMTTFETLNGQGITVILITHDQHVAERAARTLRIADGRMTEVAR